MKAVLLAMFCAAVPFAAAAAECRQALAIGMDVSGSVDEDEFRLQFDGLAAALLAPAVQQVLLDPSAPPVMLAVYDWAGAGDQRLALPWTRLTDADTLARAAASIAATGRRARSPATGVGDAMVFGRALLAQQEACWRLTLDLTGDGVNNSGPRPRDIRLQTQRAPLTVNALVIGFDDDRAEPGIAELTAWFSNEVIRGPDAFIETALGFEQFAEAMERKLIREMKMLEMSALR